MGTRSVNYYNHQKSYVKPPAFLSFVQFHSALSSIWPVDYKEFVSDFCWLSRMEQFFLFCINVRKKDFYCREKGIVLIVSTQRFGLMAYLFGEFHRITFCLLSLSSDSYTMYYTLYIVTCTVHVLIFIVSWFQRYLCLKYLLMYLFRLKTYAVLVWVVNEMNRS